MGPADSVGQTGDYSGVGSCQNWGGGLIDSHSHCGATASEALTWLGIGFCSFQFIHYHQPLLWQHVSYMYMAAQAACGGAHVHVQYMYMHTGES